MQRREGRFSDLCRGSLAVPSKRGHSLCSWTCEKKGTSLDSDGGIRIDIIINADGPAVAELHCVLQRQGSLSWSL